MSLETIPADVRRLVLSRLANADWARAKRTCRRLNLLPATAAELLDRRWRYVDAKTFLLHTYIQDPPSFRGYVPGFDLNRGNCDSDSRIAIEQVLRGRWLDVVRRLWAVQHPARTILMREIGVGGYWSALDACEPGIEAAPPEVRRRALKRALDGAIEQNRLGMTLRLLDDMARWYPVATHLCLERERRGGTIYYLGVWTPSMMALLEAHFAAVWPRLSPSRFLYHPMQRMSQSIFETHEVPMPFPSPWRDIEPALVEYQFVQMRRQWRHGAVAIAAHRGRVDFLERFLALGSPSRLCTKAVLARAAEDGCWPSVDWLLRRCRPPRELALFAMQRALHAMLRYEVHIGEAGGVLVVPERVTNWLHATRSSGCWLVAVRLRSYLVGRDWRQVLFGTDMPRTPGQVLDAVDSFSDLDSKLVSAPSSSPHGHVVPRA